MPNLEEHCKRTLQRYGVEGRDIHSWIDEPSIIYANEHRIFRHDPETVKLVGELFGKIYGKSLAENIAVDHIIFDRKRKKPTSNIIPLPNIEDFSKNVEKYEKKYENLDRIYCEILKRCETNWLYNLSKGSIEHLLRLYLFKWGRMGRVLGFQGLKVLGEKLQIMNIKLEKFRQEDLSTINFDAMSNEISNVYEEIMNTTWTSKKGKIKRIGPTATSKVLHLVAPHLFMIWDRQIRNYYSLKDNAAGYIHFLRNMQNWIKILKPAIDQLQNRYKKSCTKIIDEYNWIRSRP